MIIPHDDILKEFELINGFLFDEMQKEVPTSEFIIENFIEYLEYLDTRYKQQTSANRPDWVMYYINLPDKWL